MMSLVRRAKAPGRGGALQRLAFGVGGLNRLMLGFSVWASELSVLGVGRRVKGGGCRMYGAGCGV